MLKLAAQPVHWKDDGTSSNTCKKNHSVMRFASGCNKASSEKLAFRGRAGWTALVVDYIQTPERNAYNQIHTRTSKLHSDDRTIETRGSETNGR